MLNQKKGSKHSISVSLQYVGWRDSLSLFCFTMICMYTLCLLTEQTSHFNTHFLCVTLGRV